MAKSSRRRINLPAPYLRRVWLDKALIDDTERYPFCLPLFRDEFEIEFTAPITIFVGENGVGKSTLIEGIAALSGYDDAGGGKGYRPVDHNEAVEISGGELSRAMRAAWRPKLTEGWFFKAESFFSVARYLDSAARDAAEAPPDFLSHSHGEGFLRFFNERCNRQGIYFFDEPESALSPKRQLEFLKILRRMENSTVCQVVMATHAPLLMAYPGATLIQITPDGLRSTRLNDLDHFKLLRDFCADPAVFLEDALEM